MFYSFPRASVGMQCGRASVHLIFLFYSFPRASVGMQCGRASVHLIFLVPTLKKTTVPSSTAGAVLTAFPRWRVGTSKKVLYYAKWLRPFK
jgi:lipid-binding SYLF domain-containing protein